VSNPNEVHEAKLLNLDTSKAKFILGWKPKLNVDEAITMTVEWYKKYKAEDPLEICERQIDEFTKGH
ncbi:MAG: CDP-glucose 4,6-dehydratase, partial [Athalassotoga sp.]